MQSREVPLMIPGPVGNLEALYTPATEGRDILSVVCHPHPLYGGTFTNKVVTTVTKAYQSLGYATLRFNFRGVGNSTGSYAQGLGETEDLLSVLAYARTEWPELTRVVLAGFSFGSYICARASEHVPTLVHTVWIAPPVTHFDFTSLLLPICPCLVVQGEQDEVIEPDAVFAWHKALVRSPQLLRMPNAGHYFHDCLVELREYLQTWVQALR